MAYQAHLNRKNNRATVLLVGWRLPDTRCLPVMTVGSVEPENRPVPFGGVDKTSHFPTESMNPTPEQTPESPQVADPVKSAGETCFGYR